MTFLMLIPIEITASSFILLFKANNIYEKYKYTGGMSEQILVVF